MNFSEMDFRKVFIKERMSKESNVHIGFLLFAMYKADTMLITEEVKVTIVQIILIMLCLCWHSLHNI